MKNVWTYRVLFWTGALFVIMSLLLSFTSHWTAAWMLATFLLPSALFGRWLSGVIIFKKKRWYHWIYAAIGVLWFSYAGAIAGYWLLFELDPNQFPEVLINPVFSFLWVGAFTFADLRLQQHFFPTADIVPMVEFTSERTAYQLRLDAVLYIESRDRFTLVHTASKSYPTSSTISNWSKELPSFVRTHRSMLVNPEHVVASSKSGLTVAQGDFSMEIPISRTYSESVAEALVAKA